MDNICFLGECNPLSAHLFDYILNMQLKNWYPRLYPLVAGSSNRSGSE